MELDNLRIKDIYRLVKEGEIDPLKAVIVLKEIEKKAKEYKDKINHIALEELDNYPKVGAIIDGYNVKSKKSAGRWDFKHIQDITDLEEKLRQLKIKHKGAYLQMVHNITAIGEGGEVIIPANFKHGKEIIVISKENGKS